MTEEIKKQEVAKPSLKLVDEKTLADAVINRVHKLEAGGQFSVPKDYIVENALQSAYLKILTVKDKNNKPALEVCTQDSIATAMYHMVIQGLNAGKNQCWFIVRGDQLCMDRSYFGDALVVKRAVPGIKDEDVFANVIYDGDHVEIIQDPETKRLEISKHETKLENFDNEVKGAYSVIIKDGKAYTTFMTRKEIDMSWSKRSNNGQVQKDFPQEMAKRTVIRRGAKLFINASSDANAIIAESYNQTMEAEYEDLIPGENNKAIEGAKKEIEEHTGSQEAPVVKEPETPKQEQPESDLQSGSQVRMDFGDK